MSAGPHGYLDSALWDALSAQNAAPVTDPVGKANEDGRPIGHTTHNVFVKCKKTKKMFFITSLQNTKINLKDVGAVVGAKELRMCSDRETLLHSKTGCLTALSLFYDKDNKVEWVVEKELLDLKEPLCICAGCEDPLKHEQHNVTHLSLDGLKTLLKTHWDRKWVLGGMNGGPIQVVQAGTGDAAAAPAAAPVAKKKEEAKKEAPPAAKKGPQTKFADDHLFKWKPAEETLFATAFAKVKA